MDEVFTLTPEQKRLLQHLYLNGYYTTNDGQTFKSLMNSVHKRGTYDLKDKIIFNELREIYISAKKKKNGKKNKI